jgi:hypothetical protein
MNMISLLRCLPVHLLSISVPRQCAGNLVVDGEVKSDNFHLGYEAFAGAISSDNIIPDGGLDNPDIQKVSEDNKVMHGPLCWKPRLFQVGHKPVYEDNHNCESSLVPTQGKQIFQLILPQSTSQFTTITA